MLSKLGDLKAKAVAAELKHYLPITEKIIGQAERRVIKGEQVPSVTKAFKLSECLFKGFKNFASSVGCAVFCHNLVTLARL